MDLLFVCTWNVQRSKTAERICKELCEDRPEIKISSAGIAARNGGVQITEEMIERADRIYVMEFEHQHYIEKLVPGSKKKIIDLNIADMYYRDDPELVGILTRKIKAELEKIKNRKDK